ncbi:MAG: hypothetical protein ACFFB3_06250 [Candidatus Hodarchaeota archaeon]
MTDCSQCNQPTSQAVQLTSEDGSPAIFCLNCALNEQLSRMPAVEKTVSQPAERHLSNIGQVGLFVEEAKELRALNRELEQLAIEIFGSKSFSDILGIPTFLEMCSLCHKALINGESYFSPQISTSVTGAVDIKICYECMKQKTIHSLLEALQDVIDQSQKKPFQPSKHAGNIELELLDITKEIEKEFRLGTKESERFSKLRKKYLALSIEWNLATLKQMKEWPKRYNVLIEQAREDKQLRQQVLEILQVADRISYLAEKELKAKADAIEHLAIQQNVPILAVQLAELLWSREKRATMKNMLDRQREREKES